MPPKMVKVAGLIKLQIKAGAADPAPPVGPALGPHGVNIMEFVQGRTTPRPRPQRGNGRAGGDHGLRSTSSFAFITKTPPAARADPEGRGRGEGQPASRTRPRSATLSAAQVRRDRRRRSSPDLNANDIEAAEKIIAGTARSMGIKVEG